MSLDALEQARAVTFPMILDDRLRAELVDLDTYFAVTNALSPRILEPTAFGFQPPEARIAAALHLYRMQQDSHQEALVFVDAHDQPAGFCAGRFENATTFLIDSVGLLPQMRGQGLFVRFLRHYINYLGQVGYERVVGYAPPGNRAVIISALKAGFAVSGMDITEMDGPRVQLIFHVQPDRCEAFGRVLGRPPDAP